nr:hypothetical protein [Mycoplasmopsis bovis]
MPTKRNKLFLYLGTSAVGLATPLVAARMPKWRISRIGLQKMNQCLGWQAWVIMKLRIRIQRPMKVANQKFKMT